MSRVHCSVTLLTLFLVLVACQPKISAQSEQVDFKRDVAPILKQHCWDCHGGDEQESGLRLDRRINMLRGGDSGLAAVVPGKPEKSYLIDVIKHLDADVKMPPDEDKIPAKQIELLVRWIKQGAVWPGQMKGSGETERTKHWSYQPLNRPALPTAMPTTQPVDAFLLAALTQQNLQFSPPAEPRLLLRRLSLLLTGMPPTPGETKKFLSEHSKNADAAYHNLVERLLASPHFGERWAQHWLDVIRWAETNGSESNLYRKNAWMYRDYVVRSFNEDKPYNQFIREQVAGDSLNAGDATGFLVAGPHVPAGTVGFEPSAIRQARADRMDEILQTVGASVMAITIGCARCHNHKFDPISITDYYSLSAVFQDVEFGGRYPELADDHPRVVQEKQLRTKLNQLRKRIRQPGWGWLENWQGYQEVRFPPRTVTALRISFAARWVMADEMEIFSSGAERQNVALPSFGTTIRENPATLQQGKPANKLVNGVFGTKQWLAKSPPKSQERPWIEFHFPKPVTIDTIRISSNREDFFATDYLTNMNKISYGEFKISSWQNDAWKVFSATNAIKKRLTQDPQRKALQAELQQVIDQVLQHGRQPAFVARFIEPPETFVLARGSPESPRNQVGPAAPQQLNGKLRLPENATGAQRRRALADWLVASDNPLTARVMVNRIWHHLFGTGIVATPSDFGAAGAAPSHPELLDWLASEFVTPTIDVKGSTNKPWSVKRMIRLLVRSRAFRQSSVPNQAGLAKDAGAKWLWRFPPRRVEAEVIRDSILQASGCLDRTVGGPSYRIHNVKKRYSQWQVTNNHGPHTWRRMLYQERMRRVDDQMFTAFDFPDCGQIRAKRPISTTPLQALNLMNSEFVIDQAERIADRATREAKGDMRAAVARCFSLILGRTPSSDELQASVTLAGQEKLALVCRALINSNEFAFLP